MDTDLTAREIKDIRTRYGLSQQAFARVLGLGEASIVRYENGQKPTRANANLIRAAKNPSFMRDCLEREGSRISPTQRDRAEQIIYAEVTFNEKGEVMDINELYSLTLQQEILNEKAAEMLGDLSRMRREAEERGDAASAMVYEDVERQIALAKWSILDSHSETEVAEVRGQIDGLMRFALTRKAKAA